MKAITRVVVVSLALLLRVAPARAWSTKEHLLLTRLALLRLLEDPRTPADMKVWLRQAAPNLPDLAGDREFLLHARVGIFPRDADGIPFWAVVPDLEALIDTGPADRSKKIVPFGVSERLLHFVDLEMFMPDESRRRYAPDLSNRPTLADFPRDMNDPRYQRAGMLPFRVEQCYRKLVESVAAGRLNDAPGQFPRDEHATKWAGFLAHYAQDNTQPQHATVDYKSASYFRDFRSAPNVHADVEYRLVDDEFQDYAELRKAFWQDLTVALAEVKDPVGTEGDLFEKTLQVSMASYDALPLIGAAAVAAYANAPGGGQRTRPSDFDADKFFGFTGNVDGREMTMMQLKARQMAWAVERTGGLWLRAWKESGASRKLPTPSP